MRSVDTTARFPEAPKGRQAIIASDPDDTGVKREIRLALFEKAIDRLVSQRESSDFVIFQLRGRSDSYVQYMLHDGALLCEVGSSGSFDGNGVLDKERVTALGCLGLGGGGLRTNFTRDHLPHDARRLACLTELLLGAAYRPAPDFDVIVLTKSVIEAAAATRRSHAVDS